MFGVQAACYYSGEYVSDYFPQAFGRYILKERLAVGGMAELFLAEVAGSHGFAKSVVIKRILPHLAADQQFTSMFISEAKFTAQLAHPKIAQTLELGSEDKQLFIVMEYIEGLDVLAVLRECAHRRIRIPTEVSVFIIKEVLDALDFAHKYKGADGQPLGIVHRDVSPSNVLLSTHGDVKLIDFGIAHAVAHERTNTGTLKGKYGYMSPEQVLGQTVSPQSDVFSTGIVLAEMLMGRRLFAAANELDVLLKVRNVDIARLERFGGHIEEVLSSLLRWSLRKDPRDRYQDAGMFRDALDEWLFEQRHRVSNAQLAEIVRSLYSDALSRRKKGLLDSFGESESAAVASSRHPTARPGACGSKSVRSANSSHWASERLHVGAPGNGGAIGSRASNALPLTAVADSSPNQSHESGVRQQAMMSLAGNCQSNVEIDALPLAESEVDGDGIGNTTGESVIWAEDGEKEVVLEFHELSWGSRSVASESAQSAELASNEFDNTDVAEEQRRLSSIASPAQLAPPPKPPTLIRTTENPERSGSLLELSGIGVLYRTTAKRATGKLELRFGGTCKVIFFKRGMPEFVSSNIASELFGAYLVRREVIASGELDMALAVMPHFGGKLGDTLVGLGLMKPLDVFRHLTSQVRSKLIDVCTWTQGAYKWFPNIRCPAESFPLDLDPLEVYGAGAMAVPWSSLENWCKNRSHVRPIATRTSVVVPEFFHVAGARRCLQSMDGTRSLEKIFACMPKNNEGLHELRLIFLLVGTSLLSDAGAVVEGKQ